MDYSKIRNAEFEGIDMADYPDFVDAFCVYAEIEWEPLTDEELDELNSSDYRYDLLMKNLD